VIGYGGKEYFVQRSTNGALSETVGEHKDRISILVGLPKAAPRAARALGDSSSQG
jgi:hypothetical protein